MPLKKKQAEFPPDLVRSISVSVYKMRLIAGAGEEAVERMLEEDNDGGERLADRSRSFDTLTRCYLRAILYGGMVTTGTVTAYEVDEEAIAEMVAESQKLGIP